MMLKEIIKKKQIKNIFKTFCPANIFQRSVTNMQETIRSDFKKKKLKTQKH